MRKLRLLDALAAFVCEQFTAFDERLCACAPLAYKGQGARFLGPLGMPGRARAWTQSDTSPSKTPRAHFSELAAQLAGECLHMRALQLAGYFAITTPPSGRQSVP